MVFLGFSARLFPVSAVVVSTYSSVASAVSASDVAPACLFHRRHVLYLSRMDCSVQFSSVGSSCLHLLLLCPLLVGMFLSSSSVVFSPAVFSACAVLGGIVLFLLMM